MALDVRTLVSYERAELAIAERVRVWLLIVQLVVVTPAVLSVFVEDSGVLLWLALISLLFLGIWWLLYHRCISRRSAGEGARRASYVVGGLGMALSSDETLQLLEKFEVSDKELKDHDNPRYFASLAPPSDQRVGEMLTESVFYSKHLQAACAKVTLACAGFVVAIFLAVGLWALPLTDVQSHMIGVRLFFAFLVFVFSYDVFGAIHGHWVAWTELKSVLGRLAVAAERGYPQVGLLLLVGNYCSTMEKAPLCLPGVYEWQKERLNRLWAAYLDEKQQAVAKV